MKREEHKAQVGTGILHFAICTLFFALTINGQEWTRFRGPNGQGISNATTIPDKWTEADYNWKTELPGIGHSSPVIWGDKVFLLSANPDRATRFVLCINASDGAILWNVSYPTSTYHLHAQNSYASSTPAVDADHVYVAWATPDKLELKALDHAGKEAWTLDLGRWVSQHGFAQSPMLYGNLVILHNSQQTGRLRPGQAKGDSSMIAFDRMTGKEVWRTRLIGMWNDYAVPCIRKTNDGRDELICTSQLNGVFGLDPTTGEFIWEVKKVFSRRVCCSPVLAGDLVIGGSGRASSGEHIVAVRPGLEPELLYQDKRFAPYVCTMLAHGNLLFAVSDRGICSCRDVETGELYWRERIGGNYSGSPVIVRDKIYCIDQDGLVVVLQADKEFKEISRNPLGEPSRATPAVSGGRMYLRTYSHLISIGGHSE